VGVMIFRPWCRLPSARCRAYNHRPRCCNLAAPKERPDAGHAHYPVQLPNMGFTNPSQHCIAVPRIGSRDPSPDAPSLILSRTSRQCDVGAQTGASGTDGDAGWSSPVARQAHNLKVVGSNPAPATIDSLLFQRYFTGACPLQSLAAHDDRGAVGNGAFGKAHVPSACEAAGRCSDGLLNGRIRVRFKRLRLHAFAGIGAFASHTTDAFGFLTVRVGLPRGTVIGGKRRGDRRSPLRHRFNQ
jgi:hypothetical protein